MKKIWIFCLCLVSLSLVGCFHIPDEDWLPSRNKVKSGEIKNDPEFDEAIDSFMDWINMISSEWNEVNDEESNEISEEVENIEIEDGVINNKEIANNEIESDKIESDEVENEVSEESIPSEG